RHGVDALHVHGARRQVDARGEVGKRRGKVHADVVADAGHAGVDVRGVEPDLEADGFDGVEGDPAAEGQRAVGVQRERASLRHGHAREGQRDRARLVREALLVGRERGPGPAGQLELAPARCGGGDESEREGSAGRGRSPSSHEGHEASFVSGAGQSKSVGRAGSRWCSNIRAISAGVVRPSSRSGRRSAAKKPTPSVSWLVRGSPPPSPPPTKSLYTESSRRGWGRRLSGAARGLLGPSPSAPSSPPSPPPP